ncbi:MAG: RNA polymerase sigma factor [Oscillospiraceae bacterium]|nr:RNA polymerase sigma factor [Oscillospiraceae bacterium]
MTDAEFEAAMARIAGGDREGLRAVYDAYADKIFRIFLSKVRKREDAEDLTSEFFLKLWDIARQHRSGAGHRAWLGTIARNMAIDFLRHASHETPVEDTEEHASMIDPVSTEESALGGVHTAEILRFLSEDEQEIVRLHLAAELTFREIASVLRKPLGTVAWKYRTAIGKLKKHAEEGRLS